uniref:ATP synthase complex subunit 8 n=1 Tax=Gonocephalum kochi TaxID=2851502 RepID=A0A8F3CIE4_9CUCU|nr:ATP synthase F0 subunit 8 [Gonocephalum kochi]
MPQMAPLNWLTLMIIFIMILILFNIMNYYSFTKMSKSTQKLSLKTPITNWKW